MGFLHKLWDETLAGPAPECGLGKLRKYDSFGLGSSSSSSSSSPAEEMAISRSITVLRTNSNLSNLSVDHSASLPASPNSASSSTPRSPFSPGGGVARGEFKRLTRRKPGVENEALERAEPRTPTVYDWVVLSALDR